MAETLSDLFATLPPMARRHRLRLQAALTAEYEKTRAGFLSVYKKDYAIQQAFRHTRTLILAMQETDPTDGKRFMSYLVELHSSLEKNEIARLMLEDLNKANAYLWAFDKLRAGRLPLSLYKASGAPIKLPELHSTIKPYLQRLRDQPLPDMAEKILGPQIRGELPNDSAQYATTITDPEELALLAGTQPAATVIAHTGDYKLIRINSVAAARFYGRNTEWCTAALDSRSAFDSYNENGSLFVLVLPGSQEKFQLHFGFIDDRQIADASDTSMTFEKLYEHVEDTSSRDAIINAVMDDSENRRKVPGLLGVDLNTAQEQRLFDICYDLTFNAADDVRGDALDIVLRKLDNSAPECKAKAAEMLCRMGEDNSNEVLSILASYSPKACHWTNDPAVQEQAVNIIEKCAGHSDLNVRTNLSYEICIFPDMLPQFHQRLLDVISILENDNDEDIRNRILTDFDRSHILNRLQSSIPIPASRPAAPSATSTTLSL